MAPPERKRPSATAVVGLHLGVLLAEAVLALAVVTVLVGLPVLGFGRLLSLF